MRINGYKYRSLRIINYLFWMMLRIIIGPAGPLAGAVTVFVCLVYE